MRCAVITFPGSNCDYDLYKAAQQVGGKPEFRWHRERDLGDVDAVLLPGGFSYGDYLRAGAIARFSPIMEAVADFARRGGPVIGICNGFQILCEAGLLPGALLRNQGVKFKSRDVFIRVDNADTLFTSDLRAGAVLRIPIAHAEGQYHARPEVLSELEDDGHVVFRYTDRNGSVTEAANPNGSARGIAGILNRDGNVLGMMPHPERAMDAVLGSTDGLGIFTSLVGHLATAGAPSSTLEPLNANP